MFYKIDPTRAQIDLDLSANGFLLNDRIWVDLQGDFQPTFQGSKSTDSFQNTSVRIGSQAYDLDKPVVLQMHDTTLVAINHDHPLGDNSDPDNDYGIRVKLAAFTSGDDHFNFRLRDTLPQIQGSIYKALGGNDVVTMPDTPVQGFDTSKTFYAGAGDDWVVAGALDLKIGFGGGDDTFVVKKGTFVVPWGIKENRDNDDKIVVQVGDHKHQLVNVEVLKDAGGRDLGVKWYFNLARDKDGDLTINFFENGKLVATGTGHYDEALPTPTGQFEAIFRKGGWMGERIELTGVPGYGDILIHKGTSGGNTETDFVVAPSFLKAVFTHIEDAYGAINKALPWDHNRLDPLVPVTVAVSGQIDQPVLKPKDLVTDDSHDAVVTPKFVLWKDGVQPGLDDKSVQVFFTVSGSAERGVDWDFKWGTKKYTGDDFASGVLRQGKTADGDPVYSVMLKHGTDSVAVPLKIFGDHLDEGTERVRFNVVDIDIWRHNGTSDKLYHVSGGPGSDHERNFDDPTGLENNLVQDTGLVVTIHDHLIS